VRVGAGTFVGDGVGGDGVNEGTGVAVGAGLGVNVDVGAGAVVAVGVGIDVDVGSETGITACSGVAVGTWAGDVGVGVRLEEKLDRPMATTRIRPSTTTTNMPAHSRRFAAHGLTAAHRLAARSLIEGVGPAFSWAMARCVAASCFWTSL